MPTNGESPFERHVVWSSTWRMWRTILSLPPTFFHNLLAHLFIYYALLLLCLSGDYFLREYKIFNSSEMVNTLFESSFNFCFSRIATSWCLLIVQKSIKYFSTLKRKCATYSFSSPKKIFLWLIAKIMFALGHILVTLERSQNNQASETITFISMQYCTLLLYLFR